MSYLLSLHINIKTECIKWCNVQQTPQIQNKQVSIVFCWVIHSLELFLTIIKMLNSGSAIKLTYNSNFQTIIIGTSLNSRWHELAISVALFGWQTQMYCMETCPLIQTVASIYMSRLSCFCCSQIQF